MAVVTDPITPQHVKAKEPAQPGKKSLAERPRAGNDRVTLSRPDILRIMEENREAARSHIDDAHKAEAAVQRRAGSPGSDARTAADAHPSGTRRALFLTIP
jgi:hypothetical protein